MIPLPPNILRRIAALPTRMADVVLTILADCFDVINADFDVIKKRQNDQDLTSNDAVCQVPPAPLPKSYIQGESRELGREESKALSRKASTRMLRARGVPQGFDDFWNVYPKRICKQSTIRRFEIAIRTVPLDHIVNAAKRYAIACQSTEKQFIKAPDVWLNKGCYDDELPLANGADRQPDTRTEEQKREDWRRIQNDLPD